MGIGHVLQKDCTVDSCSRVVARKPRMERFVGEGIIYQAFAPKIVEGNVHGHDYLKKLYYSKF